MKKNIVYTIQKVRVITNPVMRVVFNNNVVVARMHCATFHPFTVRLI